MPRNKLLVLEQAPYWAPGFQQLFLQDKNVEVKTIRSVEETPSIIFPESRVIIWNHLQTEIGQNADQFSRLSLQYPEVMLCLVVPPPIKRLQWVFREMGALTVLDQSISISEAAELCRQLWKSCTIS